ncbi:MAG: DUF4350 domain-containing protein [Janthinobacterium lividum]
MASTAFQPDRRFLAVFAGVILLLIVVVSVIAPTTADNDPRPSSFNAAPGGAKALYLTMEALGRPVRRWDQPLDELDGVDAAHTTLLLAEPQFSALEKDRLTAAVKAFLERGGRVLTTGPEGALLIPGGGVKSSRRFGSLCYTVPEGPGALAAAGKVEMLDPVRWADETAEVRVEQRCGPDAVVVRVPVGRGEAIWWSSPAPLTNAELKNDADLRLTLASLGEGRTVVFDEALQQGVRSQWTAARGLPLYSLLAQAALVFGLLVFSFSRRRGPVRLPVAVPRSSPVEFAMSMGDLYEKAGATRAATEAAKRRLLRVLVRDGGLAQRTVEAGSEAVVAALELRFGGNWGSVGQHLSEAITAADVQPKPRGALALVRALGEDAERVRRAARPVRPDFMTTAGISGVESGGSLVGSE